MDGKAPPAPSGNDATDFGKGSVRNRLTIQGTAESGCSVSIAVLPGDFLDLVRRMRAKQREYFKLRSQTTLEECKALERRVDEQLDVLAGRVTPSMFDSPPGEAACPEAAPPPRTPPAPPPPSASG